MEKREVPPSWAASDALMDVIGSGITISLLSGNGAEVSHRVPGVAIEEEIALSGLLQQVCGSGEDGPVEGEVVDEKKE
jgi:hypothetical protein